MVRRGHLLFIFFTALLATFGFLVFNRIKEKNTNLEQISILPEFYFFDSLGNTVYWNDLETMEKGIVVFYVNSTCSLCQEEFSFIKNHLDDFKDAQLIFVSTEDFEDIRKFAKEFELWGRKGLTFLQDRELRFSSFFHLETVPSTLVYNAEGSLLGAFKGMVSIKKIIQLLNDGSRKES